MACAAIPPADVYSGYFRQGFEQSDFYTLDGEGPYWLTAEDAVYERLQDYLIRKPGRGSHIVTKMMVRADLYTDGSYGLGYHDTRIHVTEILDIEPITNEAFEYFAMSVMRDADNTDQSEGN